MPSPQRKTDAQVATLLARLEVRSLRVALEGVCRRYHVTLPDVLTMRRTRQVTRARGACCVHLTGLGFSNQETADLLGMEHTGVIYAKRRHREQGA